MKRTQQLRNKLKTAKHDSIERVDILNDLLLEVLVLDLEEAAQIARESAELSQKLKYQKGICRIRLNEGAILFNKDEPEKAKLCLLDALKECEACSYAKGQADAILRLGVIEWSFGEIETGFEYAQQALNLSRKAKDKFMEAWGYNVLGAFYYDVSDYKSSLKYFEKAWSVFDKMQSTEGEARALNGIGNNHLLMGNPEKALQYQERCLKSLHSSGIKQVEARARHDLANICKELGNYDDAVQHFRESLAIRRSIEHFAGEITTLLYLGELLLEMNEIEESRQLSEEALQKAEKINARPKICKAHQNLSLIFTACGRFEEALIHYKKFHELEKEIYHEAADKKLEHLQAAHQVEKSTREAEIYRLRNVELKGKNQQLKKLLNELRATQTQLVHSEKMATLGKLAAGIAHEINNPIGAASSTNQVTEGCIEKIEQAVDDSASREELAASESYQKAMRILKQNAQVIRSATERIGAIVKSLKSFVRLDEAEIQKVDIHEGIENTLALMAHELCDEIRVVKEYGKVPEIYCFPGELNQVFMNLLSNAVQAIGSKGTIHIKTFSGNGQVDVQISDTGPGIKSNKIKKLFEFDFSQSSSRVKMATGLVTVKNIVEKHKGTIEVESKIGQGTTFILQLPIGKSL